MQNLHEILSRYEERCNLRNMGLCVLTVVLMVVLTFGIFHMKEIFQSETDTAQKQSSVTERVSEP